LRPHRQWFGYTGLLLGIGLASPALAQGENRPPPSESVTVTGSKTPPDKILHDFIVSYTRPSPASGKVARWHGGVFPGVTGLPASWNASVVARVREIASLAGAPVAAADCRPNIDIVFTKNPQTLLDEVRAAKSWLLGYHDLAQEKKLATVSHALQAWYMTQTVDAQGGIYTDDKLHPEGVYLGGAYFPNAHVEYWSGNHLGDERRSELMHVLVVVDLAKVDGIHLSAVTDYVGMLSLAQTSAFDACQPVTSIANLTAPQCDAKLKTDTISGQDLAYLRALYSIDLHDSMIEQQGKIAYEMKKNLAAPTDAP
jgi:hypothetical protein